MNSIVVLSAKNVEFEDEIFKIYHHERNAQKKMDRYGFGCNFYDLN